MAVVGRAGEVEYPAAPDEDPNGRALLARRPPVRFLRLCACSVFVGLVLLIALPPSPDRIFDRASLRRDILLLGSTIAAAAATITAATVAAASLDTALDTAATVATAAAAAAAATTAAAAATAAAATVAAATVAAATVAAATHCRAAPRGRVQDRRRWRRHLRREMGVDAGRLRGGV